MTMPHTSLPFTTLYIDSRFTDNEAREVADQLQRFGIGLDKGLGYVKLCTRLPVDCSTDTDDQLEALFRLHLRQARIPNITPLPTLFIAPRHSQHWLQMMLRAIEMETGYSPYVANPWTRDAGGCMVRSGAPSVTHWGLTPSLGMDE